MVRLPASRNKILYAVRSNSGAGHDASDTQDQFFEEFETVIAVRRSVVFTRLTTCCRRAPHPTMRKFVKHFAACRLPVFFSRHCEAVAKRFDLGARNFWSASPLPFAM